MEAQQNPTNPESTMDEIQQNVDPRHEILIDYKALNGLITDEEGNVSKMPMQLLAEMIGVDRTTLYEWMKTIPNFWGRVNERRGDLSSKSRLAKVHDVMYLSALKPGSDGYRDRVLYLANFDANFRMPMQKHEHDVGDGLAELLALGRQRGVQSGRVIEGEIVDAPKE